jgi:hypothetical protein
VNIEAGHRSLPPSGTVPAGADQQGAARAHPKGGGSRGLAPCAGKHRARLRTRTNRGRARHGGKTPWTDAINRHDRRHADRSARRSCADPEAAWRDRGHDPWAATGRDAAAREGGTMVTFAGPWPGSLCWLRPRRAGTVNGEEALDGSMGWLARQRGSWSGKPRSRRNSW